MSLISEFSFLVAQEDQRLRETPSSLLDKCAASRTSRILSQPGEPLLVLLVIIYHDGTGRLVFYQVTEAVPATAQQWNTSEAEIQNKLLGQHQVAIEDACRALISGRRAKLCYNFFAFATVGLPPFTTIAPGLSPTADALIQQFLQRVCDVSLKCSIPYLIENCMSVMYHASRGVLPALPVKGPFEVSDDAAVARDSVGHRAKLCEVKTQDSTDTEWEQSQGEDEREPDACASLVLVMKSAQIKELMRQCDGSDIPRVTRLLEFFMQRYTTGGFPFAGILEICEEDPDNPTPETTCHILALQHPQRHLTVVRHIGDTDAFLFEQSEAKWEARWAAQKRAEDAEAAKRKDSDQQEPQHQSPTKRACLV